MSNSYENCRKASRRLRMERKRVRKTLKAYAMARREREEWR